MRILALSDIHGAIDRLEPLGSELESTDLVLIGGDLTDFGEEEDLRELIERLPCDLAKVLAVPGNCDRLSVRDYLTRIGASIDGGFARVGDLTIVGSGGGLIGNGLTPYERHEEELGRELQAAISKCGPKTSDPLVVLSHTPPRGSGADLRRGSALGSSALRSALDRHRPLLWICGHIHESPSARLVGQTLVVNPGPLNRGRFARIRVDLVNGSWRAEADLVS